MRLRETGLQLGLACALLLAWVGPAAAQGKGAPVKPGVILVLCPADAQVAIDGKATKATGTTRRFETPALPVGKLATYAVKVTWTEKGKEVSSEAKIVVRAGGVTPVDFRPTPEPEAKAPAPKTPEVKAPEPKVPVVKAPEVKVPKGKVPEVKVPEPKTPKTAGSFQMLGPLPALTLLPGESKTVTVRIKRQDFNGPVTLSAASVPANVKVTAAKIAGNRDTAQVTIAAAPDAAPGTAVVTLEARGGKLSRKTRLPLTVGELPAVLKLEVPGKVEVVAGGKGAVPVKIVREGFKGDVTLTVEGLPEAVKVPALTIPASEDAASVALEVGKGTTAGSHPLKVLALGGKAKAEAPLLLLVKEAPPPKVVVEKPAPPKKVVVEKPAVPMKEVVEKPAPPKKEVVEKPAPPKEVVAKPAPPKEVVAKSAPPAGKGALRVEMPEVLELQPGAVGKLLPIQIARDGVTGPVTLTFAGTPAGVTLPAATLDPDRQRLYLLTTAADTAALREDEVRLIATCGTVRQEFVFKVKVAR